MSGFVHLHNHSDYSLLDGAVKVQNLASRAAELGMKHLALTDHGNLFGVIHFENACREHGINPVIGCEVYVAPGSRKIKPTTGYKSFHMVLYCKNLEGYRNLMYLVSMGYKEGFYYKPRIDDELLENHHGGLMASSACLAGEIARMITDKQYDKAKERALFYRDLFGEGNFYLEIMDHGIPEEKIVKEAILQLSKETGIPVIATNDIHYLHKNHANAQEILICIETGKKKSDTNRLVMDKTEFYFKTEEEMAEIFNDCPEALTNTVLLAEKCDVTLPKPGPILPDYHIPDGFEDMNAYLRHITMEGIQKRYTEVTDEIISRMDFELKTLADMGFPGYFLIVQDFVNWARDNGIPVGPGRGSGAGSIVAYALGITDIDPLLYELLFERFLNPERVSMPDFDIDFCNEGRGEVINYVTRKYGYENVAGICTFGTLKTKAVLKDVARVLDIPFAESNIISKLVPEGKAPDGRKINTEVALDVEPKLKEFYDRGGIYEELFETAKILEGMNRHISTHACGMVIGKTELTDFVPLFKDQKTSQITTQFTMDIIEPCGLVKMDFLGLKTLTVLKNTEKLVQKVNPEFKTDDIPIDDKKTFEMLSRGESAAVFQFESEGMQDILRKAQPNSIEDLIALNALYRPGPMDNIPQFIECKHGRQEIVYMDPSLEEVLKPTYGVIVYQEQVMKVAQIIGGFSLGKADILRRAMGKKKVKDMEKMKVEFIAGAKERGHSEEHASDIFDKLAPFAGYGFNKSHAAAYSVVAYKTAYCKAHYPAEFMAANLTNEINDPKKLPQYMSETQHMGIEILPPDMNFSEKYFTVADGKIFYGLMGIKGMGAAAADEIIRAREEQGAYESFVDFLEKVDLRSVNKKVLEVSIKCGLFDQIETHNRATLMENMEEIAGIIQKSKADQDSNQGSLFDDCQDEVKAEITFLPHEDWSEDDKLKMEKELVGFYISGHPMDKFAKVYKQCTTLRLDQAHTADEKRTHTILGMVKNSKTIMTKTGKKMAFLTLEDFHGSIDIVIFSKILEKYEHLILDDAVLGITGTVDTTRGDKPSFKAKEIKHPGELQRKMDFNVHIELVQDNYNEEGLEDFRSFLQDRSGPGELYLHLTNKGDTVIIKANPQIKIATSDQIIAEIKEYPLVASAWKE